MINNDEQRKNRATNRMLSIWAQLGIMKPRAKVVLFGVWPVLILLFIGSLVYSGLRIYIDPTIYRIFGL